MKPTIILLHGALGSKSQLIPLKSALENDFQVFSFDFYGHGANASMAQFSIDLFVDQLIQFINERGLEQVNIFGYSMGGYVALRACTKQTVLFGKIVTLGTKFDWNIDTAIAEVNMLNPDTIEAKVPAFAKALEERHSGTNWRVHLWRTSLMMLQLGYKPVLNNANLAGIEQPVLICLGDRDKMVSREESANTASSLIAGQLLMLENTAHPIEKVDTEVLTTAIRGFIQSQ